MMGETSYKMLLSEGIPTEIFRTVTLYPAPTDAGVDKPGQPIPSINSNKKLRYNDDGSVDLYFSPEPPQAAPESNYIGGPTRANAFS